MCLLDAWSVKIHQVAVSTQTWNFVSIFLYVRGLVWIELGILILTCLRTWLFQFLSVINTRKKYRRFLSGLSNSNTTVGPFCARKTPVLQHNKLSRILAPKQTNIVLKYFSILINVVCIYASNDSFVQKRVRLASTMNLTCKWNEHKETRTVASSWPPIWHLWEKFSHHNKFFYQ